MLYLRIFQEMSYLKSFALLSDFEQFYLPISIGLFDHFQLDLGTYHCSESSDCLDSIIICLLYCFFTQFVHKFLNNLFYFLQGNIFKLLFVN